MELPTTKTQVKTDIHDYSFLIYGPPKIGKTTFCANMPDTIFLATEPGFNAQEVYKLDINSWDDLRSAYELLAAGDHGFKNIVIDTIDKAWDFAKQAAAFEYGQKHIVDVGYGKGQAKARDKLNMLFQGFAALPYGLVIVSHGRKEDIESNVGTITRETINIVDGKSKEAETMLLSLVDCVLFFTVERAEENGQNVIKRVIRSLPSEEYVAGGRISWVEDGIDMNYEAFKESFERNRDSFLQKKEEEKEQRSLDLKPKKK